MYAQNFLAVPPLLHHLISSLTYFALFSAFKSTYIDTFWTFFVVFAFHKHVFNVHVFASLQVYVCEQAPAILVSVSSRLRLRPVLCTQLLMWVLGF